MISSVPKQTNEKRFIGAFSYLFDIKVDDLIFTSTSHSDNHNHKHLIINKPKLGARTVSNELQNL